MKAVFADIRGLRTRYFIAGSGPLLMLVHPVGYPAEIFARNIDALASRFTVVASDMPGQGHSVAPSAWPAAPQVVMADQVAALASHLGFDRFCVAGSSLGGLVAALCALRFPDRVEHLILIGTGSVFNEPAGQPAVLQTVYANGSRAYADPSLQACRARIANTCHRPPAADDILTAHLTAYALPEAPAAYRAIIEGLSASVADPAATAFPHLEAIRARTLVVVGKNDSRTSYATHRAGIERMPDAQIVSIDECGHLPFLEHPERFNDMVMRFIGGADVGERP